MPTGSRSPLFPSSQSATIHRLIELFAMPPFDDKHFLQGWLGALLGNKLYYDFKQTASAAKLVQADVQTKQGFLHAVRKTTEPSASLEPAASTALIARTDTVASAPSLTHGEEQILNELKAMRKAITKLEHKVGTANGSVCCILF
eukprot:TRINITY_DN12437_c0_g1_i2.p4 TRINITY_DN12437_c0_g1~~TRINITY_DN12437_c0_g1_i2.p4  ORF type:complete len:145 (+),score=22.68 TRINITY_DN12437_c0_g1_i2:1722-2156(+)